MSTEGAAAFTGFRLRELCPRDLDPEKFLELRIDETGIESLEFMEFLMEVEEKYSINIADELITQEMTVNEFCQLVDNLAIPPLAM